MISQRMQRPNITLRRKHVIYVFILVSSMLHGVHMLKTLKFNIQASCSHSSVESRSSSSSMIWQDVRQGALVGNHHGLRIGLLPGRYYHTTMVQIYLDYSYLQGKLTTSMAMVNSYLFLSEGTHDACPIEMMLHHPKEMDKTH